RRFAASPASALERGGRRDAPSGLQERRPRRAKMSAGAAKAGAKGAARAAFQWEDPFLLEEQLSEDEKLVRDTARSYAREKLLPRVIEATRKEHFHREIMNELGELGMLGSTIEGYGCAGVNYVS